MNKQTWTTAQLINLSNAIGASCFNASTDTVRDRSDEWTSEKFVHLSQALAGGYSVGN